VKTTEAVNGSGSLMLPFDYSYISFNSIYRNRATT